MAQCGSADQMRSRAAWSFLPLSRASLLSYAMPVKLSTQPARRISLPMPQSTLASSRMSTPQLAARAGWCSAEHSQPTPQAALHARLPRAPVVVFLLSCTSPVNSPSDYPHGQGLPFACVPACPQQLAGSVTSAIKPLKRRPRMARGIDCRVRAAAFSDQGDDGYRRHPADWSYRRESNPGYTAWKAGSEPYARQQ